MIHAILGLVLVIFAGVSFLLVGGQWFSLLHLGAGLGLLGYGGVTASGDLRAAMGRGARRGGNAVVQSAALIVILALVAFLTTRNNVKWDWTESRAHSLSQASVDLLGQVSESLPIEVYAFVTAGEEARFEPLLEMYAYESDRFGFDTIDPERRPDLARRFEINQSGVLLVCAGPCDATVSKVEVRIDPCHGRSVP